MKISLLGPAYPFRGGLATFNERLARQFSSECKDTDIRTFTRQYPRFLFPGKTQYSNGPAPEGIKIIRELNSINPFSWIRTGLKIRKERTDILLIRYWLPFMAPCLGVVARIAKSNKYTVIISVVDNVIPHEKRPGDIMLTKFFMNSIDGAVVLSDSVQKEVENFRKDIPICYTPHPLFDTYGKKLNRNDALSALKLDQNCIYLLFFGFIRNYKGLDILIRAFSDSRLRGKNLKLLVAGEFYENETLYRNLVRESGLEKDVIFYDHFIENTEVGLFFSGADLVVQPYKSATQSGVTQIAYYFDKPMLVTNVGGLKEIVEHGKCGYVVEPDPGNIADAIIDYFDNNRENAFTQCVRKEKARFSWNKVTDAVTEVFYKCMLKQLIKAL
ncbi:MAG: glycosyltransferase [Bacteroidetes bacterium]|nr:glycosyltransferase [Bacteroidota bacterium]